MNITDYLLDTITLPPPHTVVFGSILCPQATQFLIPGVPHSVRGGLTLMSHLRLDKFFVSHFYNLCNQTYIGRTDSRSKIMWCPSLSRGSLAWTQEVGSSGYLSAIVRSLSCGHLCRFLGVFLEPFQSDPKIPLCFS